MADPEPKPSVRFSSAVQEIAPAAAPPAAAAADNDDAFTAVAADQLKAFAKSLHGLPLQERRMSTFGGFEAFSLPPSRVPSRDDGSAEASRLPTPSSPSWQSPHGSPRLSGLASPPLTPAGSDPSSFAAERKSHKDAAVADPHVITPQLSSSYEKSPTTADRKTFPLRPASSDQTMRRSSSAEGGLGDARSHRKGMFGVGPGSVPVSRESSPTRSMASHGPASHFYSKPLTPIGDANDPYAKGRRAPQQQYPTRHSLDPRFVFSRKKHHGSPSSSKSSLALYGPQKTGSDESGSSDGAHKHAPQSSMSDLKRFFRKPGHHKKRDSSPYVTTTPKSTQNNRATQQLPFGDDHGLTSKYGKLGKVLGSGAGGSVRLMRRKEDNTVFAVKEFRARHTYETEKEYNKKVTAEFCVGSTLHHGNVIETLDILQEKGRWFEVMEYAPFDLFAIVMTAKMSREEIRCSFLQILNGVTYLHSMGLAHRDMKLDNVVVSENGIMKIIDFGSAHVFKYPFESGSVPAKAIVGSDPYLAPEVYDSKEYDAEAVDIWSLAIIFCCMTLRRFPWKIPRMTDNSYKLFAAEPSQGHDPDKLLRPKSTSDLSSTPAREFLTEDDLKDKGTDNHHHHHHQQDPDAAAAAPESHSHTHDTTEEKKEDKKELIRGPWRILRLLPRESRHIVHRMLDLNPKTRARMEEILDEPWVADTVICQQLETGFVIPAEDHEHVLEPPTTAADKAPKET